MPDLEKSTADLFGSMFNSNNLNDPRVNPEVRKRIALQLMTAQAQGGMPKNIGEGLFSLGGSIGRVRAGDRMAEQDIAEAERAKAIAPDPYLAGGAAKPTVVSDAGVLPPPAAAGAPPPVQTASAQPQQPSADMSSVNRSMAPDPSALPPPTFGDGAQITPPGQTIPQLGARSRVALALAQRGVSPQNPTEAGGTPPAQVSGPQVVSDSGTGNAEFSSRDRSIPAAPPDPRGRIRTIPTTEKADYDYVPPDMPLKPAPQMAQPSMEERKWRTIELNNPGGYLEQRAKAAADYLQGLRTQEYTQKKLYWDEENKLVNQRDRQRQEYLTTQKKRGTEGTIQEQDVLAPDPTLAPRPTGAPSAPLPPGALPDYDTRLGTADSPQRIGMATAGPVPYGISPKQHAEKMGPEIIKANNAVDIATPEFRSMLKALREAREHPGLETATGRFGALATPFSQDATAFKARMDQIGGKNFLAAYQKLKGGGPITEIEGTKAEAAQARLMLAQSPKDVRQALLDLEEAIRGDQDTVERKVNRPVTAWQRNNNDPVAPDRGQISVFPDGRTRQYVGGNPHKLDDSWRIIR